MELFKTQSHIKRKMEECKCFFCKARNIKRMLELGKILKNNMFPALYTVQTENILEIMLINVQKL